MRVKRIEVVYHPIGSSEDPLLQRASLGLKVTLQEPFPFPLPDHFAPTEVQHGAYHIFEDDPTLETLMLELSLLAPTLAYPSQDTLLRAGLPVKEVWG
jgi:hypothetical protein